MASAPSSGSASSRSSSSTFLPVEERQVGVQRHGCAVRPSPRAPPPAAPSRLPAPPCAPSSKAGRARPRSPGSSPRSCARPAASLPSSPARLRRGRARQAAALLLVGARERLEQVGRQQPVLEPVEHPALDRLPADGPVVAAGALAAVRGAAVAVLAHDRVAAAADPADQQAREQEAAPVGAVEGVARPRRAPRVKASASCRCFTACQSASSTIRSSGTATRSHCSGGLGRASRRPVRGSLT